MIVYHGTDKESADKILSEKILRGDRKIFGPGICLTLERALNYSVIKCGKRGIHARSIGRIVVIEGLPEQILDNASLDSPDAYTLNDEFGKPLNGLHVQHVQVLTIKNAQELMSLTNKLKS